MKLRFILLVIFLLLLAVIFSSLSTTKIRSIHKFTPDLSWSGNVINSFASIGKRIMSEDPGDNVTLIAGGDVMLGRSVNTQIQRKGDTSWPFKNISTLMSSADLSIVNLEAPLFSTCDPTDTGMVFCAPYANINGLKDAGIDIVSIANNHIGNQGVLGIDTTVNTLNNKGIGVIGIQKPLFKTVKNTKMAFLGFNIVGNSPAGISSSSAQVIQSQISEINTEANLVIVSFHWGNEYQAIPNITQVELAHLSVDSGADIIIGSHPHWIQSDEIYKGKPIFYSLGNLVFDQMWSRETESGLLVKFIVNGSQIISIEKLPIKIVDYGQPQLEMITENKAI